MAAEQDLIDMGVAAAQAADGKGASDITVIDVSQTLTICDVFVISTGHNPRQVKAIAEAVEDRMSADFSSRPRRIEGMDSRGWVLMDYGFLVVHVFGTDERAFYRLEALYRDCPTLSWEPLGPLGVDPVSRDLPPG